MKKILLSFLLFVFGTLNAQIITTVAGKGISGYSGDGGPATDALLDDLYYTYPAFDNNGNMYVGSSGYHTIRKIDKAGIITTIAGKIGTIGYAGDGGPALNALIYRPTSIAVDKNNNIYFADQVAAIIRKIDATGIITTVSAKQSGPCQNLTGIHISNAKFGAISGLVFDSNDNLYISDYGCNVVYKVNPAGIVSLIAGNFTLGYSGDGGPATAAQLAYPCKPAIDPAGNVYIADAQNHRIRKVTTSGIITTVAGTGQWGNTGDGGPAISANISFPGSVIFDKLGNMYIGDSYFGLIRKIDPSGIITTFAGNGSHGYSGDGGPAIAALISVTQGRISIDANDNIYFCDDMRSVIRKISNCLSSTYTKQAINDTLCTSGTAQYSVSVSNATTLQWQENKGSGWTTISDNGTYSGTSTNSLSVNANLSFNNAQYRCVATNTCGDVYSQPVTLIVTSPQTPQLSINASATTVCAGSSITFTATAVNGGTSPVYQWKKNGTTIGVNSPTLTDNNFANNDIITCTLVSNANCLASTSATSNAITLTIQPLQTPSVSITASANNVCAGTSVTFTASAVNGGTAPSYQWKKNGLNVGTGQTTYTTNALQQGDVITCTLLSNANCLATTTANSNSISMNVTALKTPVITITATATNICPGTKVTFTAAITNGGTAPIYRWQKNGNYVGSSQPVYEDSTLQNGDKIACALVSNDNCLTAPTVESNALNITVFQQPVVTLDQTATICENGTRQLDAGNFNSYLWQDGSTERTLTVRSLGTYHVQVKDNNGCIATDTTAITTILPAPAMFLPADTAVCVYDKLTIRPVSGFRNYLWSDQSTAGSITVSKPDMYWLTVTDQQGCAGKDSIVVRSKDCLTGIYVPTAFTPNGDYLNDEIYPIIGGNVVMYEFSIFNRWGTRVFTSKELRKGWDGRLNGYPQDPALYTWKCVYQLDGDKPRTASGTFILIR